MKTTCLQENLHRALGIVGGAIPKGKASSPITQNVLIEAEGEQIKLKGTNLSATISVWIDSIGTTPGQVLVPHKQLSDLVGSFPRDKVELELKDSSLSIICGKSKAKLRVADVSEFPIAAKVKAAKTILVESKTLRDGFAVSFATASTERAELSGVKITIDKGRIEFAATDGYKLAFRELPLDNDSHSEVVIPRETVEIIQSMLGNPEEMVAMGIGEGQISFELPSFEVTGPLLAGQFPKYKDAIPSGYSCSIEVNRLDLLRCLKSAVVLPKEQKVVWGVFTPDSLLLKSRSQEMGEYESVVDAAGKGKGKIAFNGEDMVACLGSMSENKVTIEIEATTQPILLREKGYKIIVMPVVTPWWE